MGRRCCAEERRRGGRVIPYCHVAGWPFQLSKLYRTTRPRSAHKNYSSSRARMSPNGFFVSTSESKREKGEVGASEMEVVAEPGWCSWWRAAMGVSPPRRAAD
jgi:hypothetical protein